MGTVFIRLLGQVEAWAGSVRMPIAGRRQRIILAMLALRAGRTIGMPELIAAVWDEQPPQTAWRQVQNGISQLRAVLTEHGAGGLLGSEPAGYRLNLNSEEVDVGRFRTGVGRARALAAERPDDAARAFREALALWRGPALDGLAGAVIGRHAGGLDEERLCALEECVERELLGDHADRLVAELTDLVAQHPLRERFAAALMLALYRSGRQADALQSYQRIAATLSESLGVDPGPALQTRYRAILRNDPALDAPPPIGAPPPEPEPVRPAQLPAVHGPFVGRQREIGILDRQLSEQDGRPILITGTAGVGKTSLAVYWAHRNAGRFPDGQFYVNLRGFDPGGTATAPAEAMRGFLGALEVRPERIPAGLDQQAALFRSLLAGRRAMVVLDNASDAAQVRPLLPGSPTCLTLVTSRNQLAGLVAVEGARLLVLDLLTTDEARQLVTQRLDGQRVAAEPEAVDEIIVRCARLCLALIVVAARAALHPGLPLALLAKELGEAQTAFDTLSAEDPATDVRAVFSWSYLVLGAATARLFRLLGLHPGPDIATPAVASLAGLPVAGVKPLLAELTRANLLTEHSPGRYAFHDLLRAYAAEQAHAHDTEEARHEARHRVLDHYLHTACAAAMLVIPQRPPLEAAAPRPGVTLVDLTDHGAALDWFTAEHRVLLAILEVAGRTGFDTHVAQLCWALAPHFQRRGHFHDSLATYRAALEAARRSADRAEQSNAHRRLAAALTEFGRFDESRDHFQQALRLSRELGDISAEASIHFSFAWMLHRQGDYAGARDHARQAFDLYTAADIRTGQARALTSLGWYEALLGDLQRATVHCGQALAMNREIGYAYGEASALDTLGYVHHHLDRHEQALDCYEQALKHYAATGERYGEAETLTHVGDVHHSLGDIPATREAWRRALEILDDLGHSDADQVRAKLDATFHGTAVSVGHDPVGGP